MKNYHPYIIVDGKEWVSPNPMALDVAYDEALRMKTERNAEEAGVKVFTQGCVKIINWKEGRYWKGKPAYLYKLPIMEKPYYTIHFEDAGTGEYFNDFVFESKEEAYNHWAYDYPGYGIMDVKKITRDEAIAILKKETNNYIDAKTYIENREPGWKLLKEYLM